MLNVIRADIHRLRHGKAVPLAFLILMLGILFGSMITEAPAPYVVTFEFILVMPFILALIYAVCAPDFNNSTIKNSVAAGISRGTLYAARLILSTLLCELLFLCAIAVSYLGKIIFPTQAVANNSLDIIASVGSLCFMTFAMVACGCAIAFITRRGAILNVAFLGLFVGVNILVTLLVLYFDQIAYYEFMYNVSFLGQIWFLKDAEIIRALGVGAAYLVVSTVLGVVLFRRAELK